MSKKDVNVKAVVLAGIVAGSALLGGVAGYALKSPETVVQTVEVPTPFEVEKIVEVPVNVTVVEEVEVEKLVEVPVDNGDLEFVLCALEDRDIIQDCDDVVAEIKAEEEAIELAIEEIHRKLADELEDEDIVDREEDVEDIEVEEDRDEIEIKKSDYDDEFYRFVFEVEAFDDEEDKDLDLEVTVEVDEGDAKITKVVQK